MYFPFLFVSGLCFRKIVHFPENTQTENGFTKRKTATHFPENDLCFRKMVIHFRKIEKLFPENQLCFRKMNFVSGKSNRKMSYFPENRVIFRFDFPENPGP